MSWELVFLILKVLSAIGGSIGFFFGSKKLAQYLYKKMKESGQLVSTLIGVAETVEKIHKEFKPNGGNSIKDILNRIEDKSDANEQVVRVLMTHMKVPSFEADKNGVWTFVSKEWKNITKLTIEESIGNGWLNCLQVGERANVSDYWHDSVEDKRAFIVETYLYTGEKVKLHAWPITNSKGSLLRYVGLLEKITQK